MAVAWTSRSGPRDRCEKRGEGTGNVNSVGQRLLGERPIQLPFLASCLIFLNLVFVCKVDVDSLIVRVVVFSEIK